MTFEQTLERYREDLAAVEACMAETLASDIALISAVGGHLIGGGGKRLRPLLLLAAADCFGCRDAARHPLAVVLEFIHTATLLHDDVIDNAETRRGKASANTLWGNGASVLVGDYLYSQAFRLMAAHGNLAVISLLADTTTLMAEGEVFQLMHCGDTALNEADYLSIIERKTSHLIAAACAVGGILGGASAPQINALSRFGLAVGSAFQILDDTLDYIAVGEEFGKAIGKDFGEGKLTLPLIRTLAVCDADGRETLLASLEERRADGPVLEKLLAVIRAAGGIDYALDKAWTFVAEGKAHLAALPPSPGRDALDAIADFVLERRH